MTQFEEGELQSCGVEVKIQLYKQIVFTVYLLFRCRKPGPFVETSNTYTRLQAALVCQSLYVC